MLPAESFGCECCVGKIGVVLNEQERTVPGGFVFRLRPFSSEFSLEQIKLYAYFMQSTYARTLMQQLTHKSGQAFYNLGKSALASVPLPIPSPSEQEKIVQLLDKFDTLIDDLAKLERERRSRPRICEAN